MTQVTDRVIPTEGRVLARCPLHRHPQLGQALGDMGWNEKEARAAVSAYFALLRSEEDGRTVNKAALYRTLAARFQPVIS